MSQQTAGLLVWTWAAVIALGSGLLAAPAAPPRTPPGSSPAGSLFTPAPATQPAPSAAPARTAAPTETATPAATPAKAQLADRRSIDQKLADTIEPVAIRDVPARRAFQWWQNATGVSLLVPWDALALEGIDPETPLTIELRGVPAGQLLALMMRHLSNERATLMFERTPWYLEILTKEQANRRTVVRFYDIRELLHPVPDFVPPSDFGLDVSGTGNRAFVPTTNVVVARSAQELGDELAELIRQTIEPGIWRENGGQYGSIRYFDGKLIVRAPLYVHNKIGFSRGTWNDA